MLMYIGEKLIFKTQSMNLTLALQVHFFWNGDLYKYAVKPL